MEATTNQPTNNQKATPEAHRYYLIEIEHAAGASAPAYATASLEDALAEAQYEMSHTPKGEKAPAVTIREVEFEEWVKEQLEWHEYESEAEAEFLAWAAKLAKEDAEAAHAAHEAKKNQK